MNDRDIRYLAKAKVSPKDLIRIGRNYLRIGRPAGLDDKSVFLSHDKKDREAIEPIRKCLLAMELHPILEFRPGLNRLKELEIALEQVAAVAVFFGESGFGPGQEFEISGAHNLKNSLGACR